MATASKFTKVSVISSWTIKEAQAMLKLIELCHVGELSVDEQIAISAIHQSLRRVMK